MRLETKASNRASSSRAAMTTAAITPASRRQLKRPAHHSAVMDATEKPIR